MKYFITILISFFLLSGYSQNNTDTTLVYTYNIDTEINSTSWVHTQNAFKEAEKYNANLIVIHMNTYGGQVIFADSIRTKILNSKIPVYVFIDNNAASAGALISIACDSIYMRPGANIGAATVVNQSGEKMPDKYQSYMRSTIRSTAETHGKDTIITNNDTTFVWHRDPKIAEAMVDESIYIPNIIDSTKILTFTAQEAFKNGFCEGIVDNMQQLLNHSGIKEYEIKQYHPTFYSKIKGFLTNPILHGILILIIMGGIYFELQTPGVGFPLLASGIAAILYFAPLYIDGLAANWEILLFIAGVILLAVEFFVIPGFGVAGVSGIIFMIIGLSFSMVGNDFFDFSDVPDYQITNSTLIVSITICLSLFIFLFFGDKLFKSNMFKKISLETSQDLESGYVGVDIADDNLIGKTGIAETILRPSGKVIIDDELYDAITEFGIIEKGEKVKVIKYSSYQIHVVKG